MKRKALAGLAAICLLGACGGWTSCGIITTNACDPSSNDMCINQDLSVLETQYVQGHGNPRHVYVEAWLVVTVNRHPKSLYSIADLQWWDTYRPGKAEWVTVHSHHYGLGNLPESDGKPHRVNPRLEESCTPGRWRILVIYAGISSTNDHFSGDTAIPGPKLDSRGKRLRCRPPK